MLALLLGIFALTISAFQKTLCRSRAFKIFNLFCALWVIPVLIGKIFEHHNPERNLPEFVATLILFIAISSNVIFVSYKTGDVWADICRKVPWKCVRDRNNRP